MIPTLGVLKSITGVGGGATLLEGARLQPYLNAAARTQLAHGFPRSQKQPPVTGADLPDQLPACTR